MLLVWLGLGLASGVLINYIADILPATRRLSRPEWWPLTSKRLQDYIFRSRVFVIIALALAVSYLIHEFPPNGFPDYLFAGLLVYFAIVTVIDIEHRAVMHPVSMAGAVLLGGIGIWRHGLAATLMGGAVGFGIMLALYYLGEWLGRLMARARNEPWEETALGFGDVNLAGVIGLLMGWPGVIVALFVGVLLAGLFSAGFLLVKLISGKYQAFASIPYAPFLCLGAVVLVVAGVYLA